MSFLKQTDKTIQNMLSSITKKKHTNNGLVKKVEETKQLSINNKLSEKLKNRQNKKTNILLRQNRLRDALAKSKETATTRIINKDTITQSLPPTIDASNNTKNFPFEIGKRCCRINCVTKETRISQDDVGKHGIIITSPGYYRFCTNIVYSPDNDQTVAIIIASSNVVLDLDRFSLSQGNNAAATYGIVVGRDNEHVKITGQQNIASIKNFTLAGIRIFGRTRFITIENVTVEQTVPVKMSNDQIPTLCEDIIEFQINLGIAVGEGDTWGFHMKDTFRENLVEELSINHVTVSGPTLGIHIIFTFGLELLNSVITKTGYYGLLFGTSWLILDEAGTNQLFPVGGNAVIANCRFEDNKALNLNLKNPQDTFVFDFVSALALYEVENVKVHNNIISDTSNDGFIIACDHDGSHNIEWLDCQISKTRGIFEAADGLHFSGSIPLTVGECLGIDIPYQNALNVTIKRCTISDNVSIEGSSSGMLFAYTQGVVVNDCNVSGVEATEACGFRVSGSPEFPPSGRSSFITFTNCTAEKCGNTNSKGLAAGFIVDNVSDNVIFKNCIANSNALSTSVEDIAAGFLVVHFGSDPASFIRNVDFDNCVANNNGNGVADVRGGFIIIETSQDEDIVFMENISVQKSTAKFNNGTGIGVGGHIRGVSINESEVYQNADIGISVVDNLPFFASRNVAYANGIPNYIGIPEANIVEGTTINLPRNPGFLNVSIVNA